LLLLACYRLAIDMDAQMPLGFVVVKF